MAENDFINLFSLFYDAINVLKKKDLVDHSENLKSKVVVGNNIQGLYKQFQTALKILIVFWMLMRN